MSDSIFTFNRQTTSVFDVETTGLNAHLGDRICEVGIVVAQGDRILDTFQTLVNPHRPISPGAASVNGLSDEQVSQAPSFEEIAVQVLDRLDGAILICHNAPFDLGFLDAELSRLGRSWQPAGVIDTLEIARSYFHFGSNGLSALAARLGIETPHAHRALSDALTTLELFRIFCRQLMDRGFSPLDLVGSYHPSAPVLDLAVLPPPLQEALSGKLSIEITYIDADGDETIRTITPRFLQARGDLIYLVSYCHLREEERSFRLDRIVAIRSS
jgi:DNA polymerase-3 subunit epsilon